MAQAAAVAQKTKVATPVQKTPVWKWSGKTKQGEVRSGEIEAQDAVRTRLKILRRDIPLHLNLDVEMGKGEIRLAETRLWLSVKAEEISPGVSTIRLTSPNVQVTRDLYYLPSSGVVHQTDPGMGFIDPGSCPVWAQRLNQGE